MARWHDGGLEAHQFGRYLSEMVIRNPDEARQILAIPLSNKMLFLDIFELKKGSIIISGGTAPLPPFAGGGSQIYLIDRPSDVLILLKRMNP